MDAGRTAAVERRTSLLLEEVKHSYQLAWSESDQSHTRASSRVDELFAAYGEFIGLVLSQATKADASDVAGDEGWDLVWTIDHPDSKRTLELIYRVEAISPPEAVEPFDAPVDGTGTSSLGNPFA